MKEFFQRFVADKRTIVAIAFGFLLPFPADAFDLYKVVGINCGEDRSSTIGTGFSLKEDDAVLTALHVVNGCDSIKAEKFFGLSVVDEVKNNLKVAMVDVARDIALLSASALAHTPQFEARKPNENESVSLVGFTLGMSLAERVELQTGFPSIRALGTYLSQDLLQSFREIRSPDVNIDIIRLNGNAVKGHSGAPVFDDDDNIIGILIGGYQSGEFGFSWSVPLADIILTSPSENILTEVDRSRHRFAQRQSIDLAKLPNVEVPEIIGLPEYTGNDRIGNGAEIANVSLGDNIKDAMRIIRERNEDCHQVEFTETDKYFSNGKAGVPDPAFKKPIVFECVIEEELLENIYLYPDAYQTGERIFAVARDFHFVDLSLQEIVDILRSAYGEPVVLIDNLWRKRPLRYFVWPQDDRQKKTDFFKKNPGCLLLTPKNPNSTFLYHYAKSYDWSEKSFSSDKSRRIRETSRARNLSSLTSSEGAEGGCGVVLSGLAFETADLRPFTKTARLLLMNTDWVKQYLDHGLALEKAQKIEQNNSLRNRMKF